MSMAEDTIQYKIRELHGLIEDKEDVLFVLYRGAERTSRCICGKSINVAALIAMAMSDDEDYAKVIEMACDAYTAYKLNEKLKNKEI